MPDALRYAAIGDSITRGFLMGLPRSASERTCTAPLSRLLRLFDRPEHGYPALVSSALRDAGRDVELDMSLTCSGAQTDTFWRGGPTGPVRRAPAVAFLAVAEPYDVPVTTPGGGR